LLVVSHAAGAYAATISNIDTKPYTLTLIEGDDVQDVELAPDEEIIDVCLEGCIVQLSGNDDDDFEVGPNDALVIEDNALFHADEDDGAAPQ